MASRLLIPTLIASLGETSTDAVLRFERQARDSWQDPDLFDRLYRLVTLAPGREGPALEGEALNLRPATRGEDTAEDLFRFAGELSITTLRDKPGYSVYRDAHDQQLLNLFLLADLAYPGCAADLPVIAEYFLKLPAALNLVEFARVVLVLNVAILDQFDREERATQMRQTLESLNEPLCQYQRSLPRVYIVSERAQRGQAAQDSSDMAELMGLLLEVICDTDLHPDEADFSQYRQLVSSPNARWETAKAGSMVDAYACFGAVRLHVPIGSLARLCADRDFIELASIAAAEGDGIIREKAFTVRTPEYGQVWESWVGRQANAPRLDRLHLGPASLFEDPEALIAAAEDVVRGWADALATWVDDVEGGFENVVRAVKKNASGTIEEARAELMTAARRAVEDRDNFLFALARLLGRARRDLEASLEDERPGAWSGAGTSELREWFDADLNLLREAIWGLPNYRAVVVYMGVFVILGTGLAYLLASVVFDIQHSLVYATLGVAILVAFVVVPLALYPYYRVVRVLRVLRQRRDDFVEEVWSNLRQTTANTANHWRNRSLSSLVGDIRLYERSIREITQAMQSRSEELLESYNQKPLSGVPLAHLNIRRALERTDFQSSTFGKVMLSKETLEEIVIRHNVDIGHILGALRKSDLVSDWSKGDCHVYLQALQSLIHDQYSELRSEDFISGAGSLQDPRSLQAIWGMVQPTMRLFWDRARPQKKETQLMLFGAISAHPDQQQVASAVEEARAFSTIHTKNRIYFWKTVLNVAYNWLDLE